MIFWTDNYEIGNEEIDRQHKHLFELINETAHLVKETHQGKDRLDEIIVLLVELKDYARYHFEMEEEIFEAGDYPDTDVHKQAHQVFLNKLEDVDIIRIDEEQKEFLQDLLKELLDWVKHHILATDMGYREYI